MIDFLFAQGGLATFGYYAKVAIIVVAVLAILLLIAHVAGYPPPAWLLKILGIIGLALVGIIAINLLLSFI